MAEVHQQTGIGRLDRKPRNAVRTDLESIRLTAIRLLGYPDREAFLRDTVLPEPFRNFLLQAPEKDARADFAKWDDVLLKSYGERKFIPLAASEEEIYGRPENIEAI